MTPCPPCTHAGDGATCRHPLVAPIAGFPPERLGCEILDWIADKHHNLKQRADGTVLVRRGCDCPGRESPKERR